MIAHFLLGQCQERFQAGHGFDRPRDQHLAHIAVVGIDALNVIARKTGFLNQLIETLGGSSALRNGNAFAFQILRRTDVRILAHQNAVAVTAFGVHGIGLKWQAVRPRYDGRFDAAAGPIDLTCGQCLIGLDACCERHDLDVEAVFLKDAFLCADVERCLRGGRKDAEANLDALLCASCSGNNQCCRERRDLKYCGSYFHSGFLL